MERFDEREIEAVTQVIKSGKLSQFFRNFRGGDQIIAFEEEFASYIGTNYAISVSNGTVSLEITLQALGVKSGDEVITTPLSFIATGTAILRVGATPIFVDINPSTLNIDHTKIEKAITPKTVAILPVSLLGYPADMKAIMQVAGGIPVIEDAAQALGASINGIKIGTFGVAGSFSFQETKQISTLGEGGMIVTNNREVAEKCRNIRNHGNAYGTLTNQVCTNARMSEAQAAFGRVQLQKLDAFNKIQRRNAEHFLEIIDSDWFKRVYPYPTPKDINPIYLLIPVVFAGDRDKLIQDLTQKGISRGVPGQNVGYYKKLIYEHPIFYHDCKIRKYNYKRKCPNSEWARDNVLLLDLHRWRKTKVDMENYAKMILTCVEKEWQRIIVG